MTSLKEFLRRLLPRGSSEHPDLRASDFSYRIHWIKTAQGWSPVQRQRAVQALKAIVNQPDFIANEFERTYLLPEIDDQAHAGASLRALLDVLQTFELSDKAEA